MSHETKHKIRLDNLLESRNVYAAQLDQLQQRVNFAAMEFEHDANEAMEDAQSRFVAGDYETALSFIAHAMALTRAAARISDDNKERLANMFRFQEACQNAVGVFRHDRITKVKCSKCGRPLNASMASNPAECSQMPWLWGCRK